MFQKRSFAARCELAENEILQAVQDFKPTPESKVAERRNIWLRMLLRHAHAHDTDGLSGSCDDLTRDERALVEAGAGFAGGAVFFALLFAPPVLDDADGTHANAVRQMRFPA
jgi:hypothetical protein